MSDSRAIGVFDSGLGGLTAVREMETLLPNEDVIYFGDTARVPYGTKSKERIIEFSHQIMHFLLEHDVKAVIVACGTVSSNALDELKAAYDLPIIGVVEPGVAEAVRLTKNRKIGVLGTAATIRSGAFSRRLLEADPTLEVHSQACPLFVPLVENGWFDDPISAQVVARYLAPVKAAGVDTLILGCTHYPLLAGLIQQEMGEDVSLVNVSRQAVYEMKQYLAVHDMQAPEKDAPPVYAFYASDSVSDFRSFSESILGLKHLDVEKITIC